MSFNYKKILQTITFFLVVCLANGYVFAVLPDENSSAEAAKGKRPLSGILSTSGEQSVLVNGNAAFNGMTILSGMEIKTGKNSGATISLPQIGMIELTSETSVKLVFTAEQVDLQILSGNAELTTFKSITGIITGIDGKILMTNPILEVSSIGGLAIPAAAVLLPIPAATTGLFGIGMLGTAAAVGGVVGASSLVWFAATTANNANRTVSNVQP